MVKRFVLAVISAWLLLWGVGCDPGSTQSDKRIYLEFFTDPESQSIGGVHKMGVFFRGFDSIPNSIDLYFDGTTDYVQRNIPVSVYEYYDGGTGYYFEYNTSEMEAGEYIIYVKSGSVKSDSSTIRIYSLIPPTDVTVDISSKQNYVTLTWDWDSEKLADYYSTKNGTCQIFYGTTNDFAAAEHTSESYLKTCELALKKSGTYYFWLRPIDDYGITGDYSESVSVDFTYHNLTAPVDIRITRSNMFNKTNEVDVTWSDTGAVYYWIYRNTENNPDTAECITHSASRLSAEYGYSVTLLESRTYYFWVKAADEESTSSMTSDFSPYRQYFFTHTDLTPPTDLTVEKNEYGWIYLSWKWNSSSYYWIYQNTENNSSTATLAATTSSSLWRIKTDNLRGTYYFWVRSADDKSTEENLSDFSDVVSYDF